MNGQVQRPDEPEAENQDPDAVDEQMDEAGATPDPQAALDAAEAKAAEHWDRYLRAAAEIENVRKRATRDVENARKFALEGFSRDLLAVKDSLEMGIEAADKADVDSLLEGKAATLKLLTKTLERFGIEELDPVGEPFDPELHEAMTMQPSADAEPGSVLSVVQKGYSLNGRLLRPAMVIVALEPVAKDDGK